MPRNYKKMIEQERSALLGKLASRPYECSGDDHVGEDDQAQLTHDEFVSLRLGYLETKKLQQLNAALERLSCGDYGVCGSCEQRIPAKRLAAIPWAEFCVTCQEEINAASEEYATRPAAPFSGHTIQL